MDYVSRLFQVESGGNPNAQTGSYRGLAQLSPLEEGKYGITDANRTDPAAQSAAALGIQQANAPVLRSALGRAATPGEDYLAHQQGARGASALLTGGDTPAWQTIRPYYKSDAMAQKAISGNIPPGSGLTAFSPASAFAGGWVNHFENPAQGALSYANTGTQGAPMADPNDQGALASPQVYGQGALQNGGQGWQGPGGAGDTLQNVGAWLQAANNPGGAASLLQGLQAKQQQYMPKPMSLGTDPLTGKIKYGLFDPRTGSITPMGANGQQGSNPAQGQFAPDGSDFTDALQQHSAGKLDTPGLVKAAGPMVAQEADALIKGNANPGNLGNRNPALRQGGLMLAHVLDPNFNENQIPARAKIVTSLTSPSPSSFGGALTSAEAVANHAETYMRAARELNDMMPFGGDQNDANAATMWLKSHSTDTKFKSLINAMNTSRDFIAGEAVKSSTGSNGSMSERRATADTLDPKLSLAEKQKSLATLTDIVTGKIEPLVHNYNEAFGLTGKPGERSVESFLSNKTKASLAHANASGMPDQSTVTTTQPAIPKVGFVSKGYVFKGGDPADQNSWSKQ